ncbi:TIM barrel protein [Nocardia stercoris]|uniref:Inosose dehydratase n=1 Tax=Nocardia stercoris TaxID=2483361 RepID=A0A3M2LEK6_9NOCA|nr:TIM barrel protein [Nocardia stercoris]RMI35844.1 inosose dehydratase [Nocardia stercoris]
MTEPLPPLRLAAAPISWGVCEVPDWGAVLDPDTVLGEMRALGFRATELGPPGYLPDPPRALLDRYGLTAVGGFAALPLSRGPQAVRAAADQVCRSLAGAEVLVLGAGTGAEGYDGRARSGGDHRAAQKYAGRGGQRPDDQAECVGQAVDWSALVDAAGAVRDLAAGYGLRTVLHPHVGTHIESAESIERFLADSDLDLCLDTGHVLAGGGDPLSLVRRYPQRIGHVHLKDVRAEYAAKIRSGGWNYADAVGQGLYVPLGCGDVDIAAIVRALRAAGYRGWYVLEQDTRLAAGDGPDGPRADVAASLQYLEDIAAHGDREAVAG